MAVGCPCAEVPRVEATFVVQKVAPDLIVQVNIRAAINEGLVDRRRKRGRRETAPVDQPSASIFRH